MRILTPAAQALIQQKLGLEAIVIVQIAWNGVDFVSYADRDYEGVSGKILEMGNLDDVRNLAGTGSNAQVSIKLDDTDGTIKAMMDQYDVQKMPIIFLQTFATLGLADAFVIFRGAIVTPIMWSEQRTVSVEAITHVESVEVGFSPEEAQFQNVSPSLWNKVWPLALGSCLHVPAVKSWERQRGVTSTGLGVVDYTLPYKYYHLIERLSILSQGFDYYLTCINTLRQLIGTSPITFPNLVTDINFPQGDNIASSVNSLNITQMNVNATGDFANAPATTLSNLSTNSNDDQDTSAGDNPTQDMNSSAVIPVINQMEMSYSEIIVTEQRLKQDHEDLATFIQVFNKSLDKLQNLLQTGTTQQQYITSIQGIITYVNKSIVQRNNSTGELVDQIVIPTPQSVLFTTTSDDETDTQSDTLQQLLQICQDFLTELNQLLQAIQGASTPAQMNVVVKATVDATQTVLDQQEQLLISVTNSLEQLKGIKERLQIDMENCEYAYKTI